MILDNEEQRAFLLELMQQVTYPGKLLDIAYAVKSSVVAATITKTASEPVRERVE